jgi:hypothetical protein
MKDGRVFEGTIAKTSIVQGWLALVLDKPSKDYPDLCLGQRADEIPPHGKLHFKDMVSAVTKGERIGRGIIGDEDLLAKYRRMWEQGREYKWEDDGNVFPDEPCPY